MKTLGEIIKEYRERENWPQRKLAYVLDIDVAVLSRIENDNKFPKKRVQDIIHKVSNIFNISEEELKQIYLSDEIASMLAFEENYNTILKVSEEKVQYKRMTKIEQSKIKFTE